MRPIDSGQSRLELNPKPVLFWGNPAANSEDGAVFVWLRQERPQVIDAYFTYRRASTGAIIRKHSLHSLAGAAITADFRGHRVWPPKTPGVEFRNVSDALSPAGSAHLRLSQMKSLAKDFSGKLAAQKAQSSVLRLLPQPLARYEPTGTDVIDRAIFSLAEGTDSRTLVLIKARDADGSRRWKYAFVRFHFASLWGHHRDTQAWRVEADLSQMRAFLGDLAPMDKLYISLQKR